MTKKKIATFWLGGCSGCHMSFLDMDERILEVAKLADIVRSPIVDGKEIPEIDVALVEGSIATEEHLEEIHKIRRQAKALVSFGDCAVTGNITTYRNPIPKEAVLKRSYLEAESNVEGVVPDSPEIGKLLDRVMPLHEAVKVDFYIPGCPPSADLIFYVVSELLNDRTPVLSPDRLKYG